MTTQRRPGTVEKRREEKRREKKRREEKRRPRIRPWRRNAHGNGDRRGPAHGGEMPKVTEVYGEGKESTQRRPWTVGKRREDDAR